MVSTTFADWRSANVVGVSAKKLSGRAVIEKLATVTAEGNVYISKIGALDDGAAAESQKVEFRPSKAFEGGNPLSVLLEEAVPVVVAVCVPAESTAARVWP